MSIRKSSVKSDTNRALPSVQGVGYLGVGKYNCCSEGVITKEYRTWEGMLKRCYSPKCHKTRPNYQTCTVSSEFLNFQHFAEWCNQQIGFGNDGWHLDKDILCKAGSRYSAETCIFVPQAINSLVLGCRSDSGNHPVGVSYRRLTGKYCAKLSKHGQQCFLGYYNTPELAFLAYKEAKESYVKDVAEQYKDKIDPRGYEALIEWEVVDDRDWRERCALLQAELDEITKEMLEWKTKFERLMLWKEQPRLPIRGLTTMGHRAGDDGK